jgi:hypothetical protein
MIPDMEGVENPNPTGDADSGVNMDGEAKHNVEGDGDTTGAAADPNQSREDILSQLVKLHAESLKELEAFAQSIGPRLAGVEGVTAMIPDIQGQLGQLEAQVDELTPPTPLQAMAKIVDSSGGMTPEEWWNKYFADHGQKARLAGSPYYPKQKGDEKTPAPGEKVEYVMKPSDLPDLTPEQANNSFNAQRSY